MQLNSYWADRPVAALDNDVNELCAAMQRVAREQSRWIHGRLWRAIGGFAGVCLVPSAAHAHGQEVLVPLAGSIYAFPLFVLVVIGLPARLNTKLWCIAAYLAGTPIAWLGTAGLVTRENANFVVFIAGVFASVLGLIPWIATPKGKR